MKSGLAPLLLLAGPLLAGSDRAAAEACRAARSGSGIATHYEAVGDGACGFAGAYGELAIAVTEADWAGSALCGRCVRVSGPAGTRVARVVDLCPGPCNREVADVTLDLSQPLFAAVVGPLAQGIGPVRWETVACGESGNLRYVNGEGIGAFYYAVQARFHEYGVAAVEIRDAGRGRWLPMTRSRFNFFSIDFEAAGALELPFDLRVTDVNGQTLTSPGVITNLTAGAEFDAGANFPACEPPPAPE